MSDPITSAWQCLADACLDHDQPHEQQACAELRRLGQLIPTQRSPLAADLLRVGAAATVAARMLAASDTAVVQLSELITSLHSAAAALHPHDPDGALELRGLAEQVSGRRNTLRRLMLQDFDVPTSLPEPAALHAALTPDPLCLTGDCPDDAPRSAP